MSEKENLTSFLDHADEIFVSIKNRKKSRSLYEKALKIASKIGKTNEINYIKGKIALIDRDPLEAIKYFKKITNKKIKLFLKAKNYQGVANDILGRYKEAINCYGTVLKIDPTFSLSME